MSGFEKYSQLQMLRAKLIKERGQEGWEKWYREILGIDRDPPERSKYELDKDVAYWLQLSIFEENRYIPKICPFCGRENE